MESKKVGSAVVFTFCRAFKCILRQFRVRFYYRMHKMMKLEMRYKEGIYFGINEMVTEGMQTTKAFPQVS